MCTLGFRSELWDDTLIFYDKNILSVGMWQSFFSSLITLISYVHLTLTNLSLHHYCKKFKFQTFLCSVGLPAVWLKFFPFSLFLWLSQTFYHQSHVGLFWPHLKKALLLCMFFCKFNRICLFELVNVFCCIIPPPCPYELFLFQMVWTHLYILVLAELRRELCSCVLFFPGVYLWTSLWGMIFLVCVLFPCLNGRHVFESMLSCSRWRIYFLVRKKLIYCIVEAAVCHYQSYMDVAWD